MDNAALECQIAVMLRLIGVQPNVRGWRYIVTATELVVQDEDMIHAMTKRLYPAVASKHATTPTKVERAMRHAIESAWTHGDWKMQQHYFGNITTQDKGKPTNGAFIAGLASWCRQ